MKKMSVRVFSVALIVALLFTGCSAPPGSAVSKEINEVITVKSERDTDIYTGVMVPSLEKGQKAPLVILVHGFLGNKDEYGMFSGGVHDMPGVADQLLELGIASMRVNFPGTGDSKESFENYNMDNMLNDLNIAYKHVLENYQVDKDNVAILGWSMGGKVASVFAGDHPDIGTMLLWVPVAENGTDGLDFLDVLAPGAYETAKAEGRAYIEQDYMDRDIYLSYDFITTLEKYKPLDSINKFEGNKMVIIASEDTLISKTTFEKLINETDIEYLYLQGSDHDFGSETNNPRYTKILMDTSISYLYRHLMGK